MSKMFGNSGSVSGVWKYYLRGIIIGTAVTFAAMLICAAVILFLQTDRAFAAPMATVCVAIGALIASFVTAYGIGDKGYKAGLITALIFLVVITVISIIINGTNFTLNTLFHWIIILLSGLIGGIMGVNRKTNKKYI